jgi:HK97 family phage major capsid protein
MSLLADQLKKQYEERKTAAASAWQAFEEYRKSEGDEKLSKDKDSFAKANELHAAYGVIAEEAKSIEANLMAALAMDSGDAGSLKDIGSDGPATKGGEEMMKRLTSLAEKAMDRVIESPEWKAYSGDEAKMGGVSFGQLFAVKNAIERGELKTLLTGAGATSGDPLIINDRQAGIVEAFDRVENVLTNLITVGTTDSDTVEWVRLTSVTNNAAETAEAVDADKAAGAASSSAPESALALDLVNTPVQEIKHFIPATKRGVADAGQLRTLADQELLRGLDDRLDNQILNGSGTGVNLKGILNTSGTQAQSISTDPVHEAILKGLTKLVISGFGNLTILMNATDWQTIRLSKNANGDYYYGPPSVAGPRQMWGYPVVLSQRLAAGTYVTADFRAAGTLWLREGATLAATDSHSDWFTKGIIAILASMRAAFALKKPRAVCVVS